MPQRDTGEFLAYVTRGGVTECRHSVHVVACSPDQLLCSIGAPELINPLRSTAKPLMTESSVPMLAPLLDAETIALISSSHNGEPQHVRRLRHILRHELLAEDMLNLGNHPPIVPGLHYEPPPKFGILVDALQNNCSGKHVGLLLLARALGQDPATYADPTGNALRHVANHIKSLAESVGCSAIPLIDGCGIPTFGVTLTSLARIYARFYSTGISPELATIRTALLSCPKLVGGSRRATTALLEHGLLAKDGFDGLFALAFEAKGGVPCGLVIKVDSGSNAIAEAVAMAVAEILTQRELDAANVHPGFRVTNQLGQQTGEIQVRRNVLYDLLKPLAPANGTPRPLLQMGFDAY